MSKFRDELQDLINRESQENVSHTPDFILTSFLIACLGAFDDTTRARDAWHGFEAWPKDDPSES